MFQFEGVTFVERHAAADGHVIPELGMRGGVNERGALVRIERKKSTGALALLLRNAVREPDAHSGSRLVHRPGNHRVLDRSPRGTREPLDYFLPLPVRQQSQRETARSVQ